MKHSLPITTVLVLLFVTSQLIGLGLVYMNQDTVVRDGERTVEFQATAIGERPALEGAGSFLFLVLGVAIGTVLVLLLVKFKAFNLWRIWFLLAVWLAVGVAFGVLLPSGVALLLALILAAWKVYRPNPIIHNLTEVFIYGGITVLLAPLFDLFWAVLLLVVISIYDMIAVWKSKHMITMAKAQADSNLFAGLYVPKGKPVKKALQAPPKPKKKSNVAILGGGDIAFPMLFTAVVLVWLLERGIMPAAALSQASIIIAAATISLIGIFALSEKGKFYPAMPFLTAGCFAGLGIIWIIAPL